VSGHRWLSDGAVARLRDAAAWPDLGDRYQIHGVAGRGGTSTVYAARDRVLDRDVAVKVADLADRRGERVVRLSQEAHILARLDHPGIVPVHDAGVLPDGRAFYVMKLVTGRRFDAAVAAIPVLADRLALFGRVLEAVQFAHAHGVVHRDLKPENIMVGAFGEVLVMDWGVAQAGPVAADADRIVVGTPGFMPPEQAAGAPAVDGRADVFALGAVLAAVVDLPAPAPLAAIANQARAADPAARYQSVAELAADLARFRDRERVSAYDEPLAERLLRIYRRYELPILLVLAYMVMRVTLLLWARV
jgi:aminoglycoside phosphotransferase (APT) family kinase protein